MRLNNRSVVVAVVVFSAAMVPPVGWPVYAEAGRQTPQAAVVFTRDVAPILYRRCTICHHAGGVGPFSLLTYEDARPRARQIADVVRRRLMPPWKPEAGYGGPFVGERRLGDDEIARVEAWVTGGAVEGDSGDLPPIPVFEDGGWQLGVPDLVIAMPQPYTLPAGERDLFRIFVIPIPVSETRYVEALEFQPSNRAVAHHATLRIDESQASRRLDERDAAPGYDGPFAPSAGYPDGHILAWTPGQVSSRAPAGMSWRLEPESSLAVQMHMVPTDKPEPVQLRVGLYFTDVAPARFLATLRLGRQAIDIEPGESRYVVSDRYVLPVDAEVHAVQPHAHYLAKEIKGFATLPDGTRRWLVYIKAWDFHWQDVYRYRDPLWLPKGTALQMEYTYDNSSANRRNPTYPPKRVRFGEQTTDEMAYLFVQVVPRTREERVLLLRDFRLKDSAEDVIGYRTRLDLAPDDAGARLGLASSYLALGRFTEGIDELREWVRREPASSESHYNLATALAAADQTDEAAGHFRQAIELDPADPVARNSLGALLFRLGRVDDALQELREAVRIAPRYVNARNNLGVALQQVGQVDEAVRALQEAVRLAPSRAESHFNLANVLRLSGRSDGAIDAYMKTLAIDPTHERACFNLGIVLEARGRYSEAVDSYRRALALNPGGAAPMTRLAWILATAPDMAVRNPTEAVELAEEARARARRDDPVLLDTLAAAYAAAGRFELAIAAAERALAVLGMEPAGSLAEEIQGRLGLYRDRRTYTAGVADGSR